jgi:hypothetical protein
MACRRTSAAPELKLKGVAAIAPPADPVAQLAGSTVRRN